MRTRRGTPASWRTRRAGDGRDRPTLRVVARTRTLRCASCPRRASSSIPRRSRASSAARGCSSCGADTPPDVRRRYTDTALTAMDALCGLAERRGTDAVWDALELVTHRELLAFATLMASELAETDFALGPPEPRAPAGRAARAGRASPAAVGDRHAAGSSFWTSRSRRSSSSHGSTRSRSVGSRRCRRSPRSRRSSGGGSSRVGPPRCGGGGPRGRVGHPTEARGPVRSWP